MSSLNKKEKEKSANGNLGISISGRVITYVRDKSLRMCIPFQYKITTKYEVSTKKESSLSVSNQILSLNLTASNLVQLFFKGKKE